VSQEPEPRSQVPDPRFDFRCPMSNVRRMPMSFVFITYAPDGEELARTLARGLEIHGFRTWYR